MDNIGILEGILFVVGNDGITKERLIEILNINEKELENIITNLNEKYNSNISGISLEFLANRYKLVTRKEHKKYYEKLVEVEKNDQLSQAALETLAVIAYNSPTTRGYVDDVRGVESSYQVRKLLYRNLIQEVGRADLPGRPILYAVTNQFLDYLGLASIDELPELCETIIESDSQTNLYESKYSEKV